MDTKSSQYVDLRKVAVDAVKQVCLGAKAITIKNLQNYCVALQMRQVMNRFVVSSGTYSTAS
jgi:hypothetical protein